MYVPITQFGAEAAEASGIGALGLNLQSFLFQLITFVLVLVILRKFVYGRLVDTLEKRRLAVVESLEAAQKAAKDLDRAEEKVEALLKEARVEAQAIIETAHKESANMVEEAESKAAKRADHLIAQAEARLEQDTAVARETLRRETTELVALATGKILHEKVDAKKDAQLIQSALASAKENK